MECALDLFIGREFAALSFSQRNSDAFELFFAEREFRLAPG